MNITAQNSKKALLLTLCLGISQSQAQTLDPSIITQIGKLGKLFDSWNGQLQKLMSYKDQLFGEANVSDLADQLTAQFPDGEFAGIKDAANAGGSAIGSAKNLYSTFKSLISSAGNWQSQITQLKSSMKSAVDKETDRLFNAQNPENFEAANGYTNQELLNPSAGIIKGTVVAMNQDVAAKKAINAQAITDSAKGIVENQNIQKEMSDTSSTTNDQASQFASDSDSIQSTREGVVMLIKAQAAALANSSYNAQALTTALGQQAKQQQITNSQLSQLVNEELDKKTSQAKDIISRMQEDEVANKATADQVKSNMEWINNSMSAPFSKSIKESGIDQNTMFASQ